MPLLSHDEFQATFAAPMQRLRADVEPPLDVWSCFDTIPTQDFFGRHCKGTVADVYRDASARFEHVQCVECTENADRGDAGGDGGTCDTAQSECM